LALTPELKLSCKTHWGIKKFRIQDEEEQDEEDCKDEGRGLVSRIIIIKNE
jgi:hypothetical protein